MKGKNSFKYEFQIRDDKDFRPNEPADKNKKHLSLKRALDEYEERQLRDQEQDDLLLE